MMYKIVYITSTLGNTGPTNQLYNVIKYLDTKKYKPYLITLSPEPSNSRWDDFVAIGVDLKSLNLSRIAGVFRSRRKVLNLIDQIGADLVHTHGIRADVISSTLGGGLPKIATVHNYPQYDYLLTYGKFKSRLMLYSHIKALKKLNLCVAVSSSVAKNMADKFNVTSILPILNGVDTDLYNCDGSVTSSLRGKLNIPPNSNVWVSAGHLTERKNPMELADSFVKAFANDENNFLLFLGDGDLKKELIAKYRSYKNIIFKGSVNNVLDYLKISNFFCSSSTAEGLPMATIEAMACGLPVLLSDIQPHKEIFQLNPDIGGMYSLNHTDELAELFRQLTFKSWDLMSDACLSVIDESLSARIMSEKYQDQYLELLK